MLTKARRARSVAYHFRVEALDDNNLNFVRPFGTLLSIAVGTVQIAAAEPGFTAKPSPCFSFVRDSSIYPGRARVTLGPLASPFPRITSGNEGFLVDTTRGIPTPTRLVSQRLKFAVLIGTDRNPMC